MIEKLTQVLNAIVKLLKSKIFLIICSIVLFSIINTILILNIYFGFDIISFYFSKEILFLIAFSALIFYVIKINEFHIKFLKSIFYSLSTLFLLFMIYVFIPKSSFIDKFETFNESILREESHYKMLTINNIEYNEIEKMNNYKNKVINIYVPNDIQENAPSVQLPHGLFLIKSEPLNDEQSKKYSDFIKNKFKGRKVKFTGMSFSYSNKNINVLKSSGENGNYFLAYDRNEIFQVNYSYSSALFDSYPKFVGFKGTSETENKDLFTNVIHLFIDLNIKYIQVSLLLNLLFIIYIFKFR
jgi:hypothetical protein